MNTDGIGVLVGMDQSACSQTALAWATADAVAKRVPLTIAGVVDRPRLADVPISRQLVDAGELAVRQRVEGAATLARGLADGIPVNGRVLVGDPAAELLRLAHRAEEVVVGSHGTGQFGRLLVGSVGSRVAEYASCPAVVVRGEATADRVVVGIDTSPHSEPALRYAFDYADAHGKRLVVLHAFTLGAFTYPFVPYPVPPYPIADELARIRTEATRSAEQGLGVWTEKYPEVEVSLQVVEGPAAHELVDASRTAGLLVVGTRERGGLTGMLLGSVSHAVLRHAHCPVVIAR